MSNAAGFMGVGDAVRDAYDPQSSPNVQKEKSGQPAPNEVVLPSSQRDGKEISFAEYIYWAKLRREEEDRDTTVIHSKGIATVLARLRGKKSTGEEIEPKHKALSLESGSAEVRDDLVGLSETDRDLLNARRVLRQAGWATVFYLVTCDILGPFSAPYSIEFIGLAPGVCLYILFGGFAMFTGVMISQLFLRLDSVRYPVRTYGDLGQRIFGSWMRHVCSFLQTIQLVLNVGLICLSNGQSLVQIVAGPHGTGSMCFIAAVVIWAGIGMVLGLIRSLHNFSVLANTTVWLNLTIIFISMGYVAHSPPNFKAAVAQYGDVVASGPISVLAIVNQPVFASVNGVFNMVFAFGGAMIFPEIMAEMRRPRDFIKGMAVAQILIITVYLLYGCFVYSYQGQYTLSVAYQGVSAYGGQTACNVLALVTGIVAAGLYGNIGLKVAYINIVEGLFRGPSFMSPKGRLIWTALVPLYWGLAFCVASAIPAVGALSGLVAAVCIYQFSYTFPFLLMLGLDMQLDASLADEPFDPHSPHPPKRIDTWRDISRWRRGFMEGGRKRLLFKTSNLFWLLCSLATAGLGCWATGTDLREALATGASGSFSCTAPV